MSEQTTPGRRRRRLLTPEARWEAFLEVTSRELTQTVRRPQLGVDTSVVIKLRRDAKQAAPAAFAASKPGATRDPREVEVAELRAEVARLTEVRCVGLNVAVPGCFSPHGHGSGVWLLRWWAMRCLRARASPFFRATRTAGPWPRCS